MHQQHPPPSVTNLALLRTYVPIAATGPSEPFRPQLSTIICCSPNEYASRIRRVSGASRCHGHSGQKEFANQSQRSKGKSWVKQSNCFCLEATDSHLQLIRWGALSVIDDKCSTQHESPPLEKKVPKRDRKRQSSTLTGHRNATNANSHQRRSSERSRPPQNHQSPRSILQPHTLVL